MPKLCHLEEVNLSSTLSSIYMLLVYSTFQCSHCLCNFPMLLQVGIQNKSDDLCIKTTNLVLINVLKDQVRMCHLPRHPQCGLWRACFSISSNSCQTFKRKF